MRILIRTSRLAIWARRLGSFALPLAVIPIPLHRAALVNSDTFILIETLAMGFAGTALLIGLSALVRLWITGDRGWNRAITGVFMGAVCLSPVFYGSYMATRYPLAVDVSTTAAATIELEEATPQVLDNMASREEILAAFPDARARNYALGVNETFRVIDGLVQQRGWQIIRRDPPDLETADGQINAIDTTLLGWRDEVAIAVTGSFAATQVQMRSASVAAHGGDLGQNGRRIEAFLGDLDAAILADAFKAPAAGAPPVPAFSNSVR